MALKPKSLLDLFPMQLILNCNWLICLWRAWGFPIGTFKSRSIVVLAYKKSWSSERCEVTAPMELCSGGKKRAARPLKQLPSGHLTNFKHTYIKVPIMQWADVRTSQRRCANDRGNAERRAHRRSITSAQTHLWLPVMLLGLSLFNTIMFVIKGISFLESELYCGCNKPSAEDLDEF